MQGADVFFLLMGAILVFAMHGGFAFLEVGTVRHKNQVNALVQDPGRFRHLDRRLFLHRLHDRLRRRLLRRMPRRLPAAPRATARRALRSCASSSSAPSPPPSRRSSPAASPSAPSSRRSARRPRPLVGLFYPLLEGIVWNKNFGLQESFFKAQLGAPFKDFAGSIVVHAFGGWVRARRRAAARAAPRPLRQGSRHGIPPSSIPWLAMGSWLLCIGWFGFNVMSAQTPEGRLAASSPSTR